MLRMRMIGLVIAAMLANPATSRSASEMPNLVTVNRVVCAQMAPVLSQLSQGVGQFLGQTDNFKTFDQVVEQFPAGSKEREAMEKFTAEMNRTITALQDLRKASRDAAYVMDVCSNG